MLKHWTLGYSCFLSPVIFLSVLRQFTFLFSFLLPTSKMLFHYSTVVPIIARTKEATQCTLCGKEKGSGKMFRCRGCKIASYCCRAHAKSDWKNHQVMCKEVQSQDNSRAMQRSQSLVKDFGHSIRAFIDKTFKTSDMPKKGEIYRATKQGDRFYIHEFSMGEFITVATGLMPEEDRRKAFLKESFESLQNGELAFVLFSTRTKAHAIVTVKPLN